LLLIFRWSDFNIQGKLNPSQPLFAKGGDDAGVSSFSPVPAGIMQVYYINPNPFSPALVKGGVVANAI